MADRDRPEVVYADAALGDADWIKGGYWDFADMTLDDWRATPLDTLEMLVNLPAFTAAPEDVRTVILDRLGSKPTDAEGGPT